MPDEIAIVGMAGRFPGAPDLKAFWRNLRGGVESVRRLEPTELEDSPYTPRLREHPDFVAAAGILDDADLFDHGLFGMSRRESRITDPQQRVFLELAWAALEDAGIDPFSGAGDGDGRISVYAGASNSGHLLSLIGELGGDPASVYEAMTGATSDNLATRVAFALRLRGEAVTLHTACSTGLSVVHAACQSLLLGQSRVALAGSVRIAVPQRTGYAYQEGMILSRDGHCRAFDAESSGTVPGNGAGVVVLKPVDAALADGDHIYALIRATAINNDGHRGVGYTAPSVGGQAEVITEAMAFAGVSGDDIGYVEAHGTGTPLGDPIEIAALTRAYRASTQRLGDCPIGSVKSNIGHLDTAAGIAGLIKVALTLHHGEIPPTLHVRVPNPNASFAASPFFPVTELRRWPEGTARLAAVSSFGIGGTNVHAILEQAPQPVATAPSPREHHLVTLSAQTPQALDELTAQLADALSESDSLDIADVAWTRAVGRAGLPHRRTVVATGTAELANSLRRKPRATKAMADPRVVFLFPGQGSASHGMAGQLYHAEPVFREELENVLAHLDPHLDTALLPVLLDGDGPLLDPVQAHAGLFAVEYALARLWQRWGIRPHAVLGHSFGEYAAACVAGVWSLPDAARLAVLRGRLVARMPEGGMLAVAAEEAHLLSYLDGELSLAAVNGAGRCVVSGPPAALAALGRRLEHAGFAHVPLGVAKAFHSASVEPVLDDLRAAFAGCSPAVPGIGLVSSLTGQWWSETDGTPDYWARQMREPVRFADALETLTRDGDDLVFLEAGPDQALTALTRAQLGRGVPVAASLRRQGSSGPDQRVLLEAAGTVWRAGARLDRTAFYSGEKRRRVSLPAYPFEHTEAQAPRAEVSTTDVIERQVLLIWQERLGADDFGVHDNFLELGGNSLMAAQVLTRLRETFGVDLPLSALFDAPTVAGVAEQIRRLSGSDTRPRETTALPHPQKLAPQPNPPLSVVQQRTLALEAADPGITSLLMPIAVCLDGPLDVEALRAALRKLAERHDALRTTFHLEGGAWTARLGDNPPALDYDELPPGTDPAAEACAIAALEAARPVDLAVCPLRLRLLRFGAERHLLLLTMHHVIADTWSMLVFVRELAALHDGQELPAPRLQYADFAAWQRRNLSGGALAGQQAYWRGVLQDAPGPLPLPTDRSRALESGARGYRIPVEFSPELSQRLTDVCHRGGFTPFAAVLAGYAALLARITGSDDVIVGTPIGNRERPELQGLIGYVAHCVPLRARLGDDPAFWELAERAQHAVADAYRHPDLPYEHLARFNSGRLFADAAFVMHSGIDERLTSGGTTWTLWPIAGLPAQFGATLSPLTLMLTEHDGSFGGVLEYAAELFTQESAQRLVRQLATLLDSATREPHLPLSQWEIELAVAR